MSTVLGRQHFDDLLKPLRRALRTLPGTSDRPIARRNARRRVLTAVRAIRATVDREYPAIIVRGKVTRLKTVRGQHERAVRRGLAAIENTFVLAFLAAGVKPIRREFREGSKTWATWYVPSWAKAIGTHNPALLRRAKKSIKDRHAAITIATLQERK